MELLPYTDDHRRFREEIRDFCEREVSPFVDLWEKDGLVPRQTWKKMGERGFLCTWAPPRYGGRGGDFLHSIVALEEMARTNHYGLDAFLHSDIVAPYIASYGSEAQKERYLPGCVSGDIILAVAMTEPGAGSDLASLSMTAVEDGGAAVLNGAKTFISNGLLCDLVVTAARDEGIEDRRGAISLYLVESGFPGFSRGKGMKKLGARSQDTAELFFSGCRVPLENRLGEKGAGYPMLMEKLQQERLLVAVLAVCKAEYALSWTTERLKGGPHGGKKHGLSPAARFALVEMETELRLGRTFVESLILSHMAKKDITGPTCMAKYWASDMANRVASSCLDLLGAEAAAESCPIARTFRDLRVFSIFAGTNEIMKVVAAKSLGI